MGHVTYVAGDYWPLNTAMYVEDFFGNNPRYVAHLLSLVDFMAFNSGSAQPSLNRNYIAGIPISLPPPGEQRAVAEVLGALDDKIADNELMAETVLELAKCLYIEASSASIGWRSVRLADTATWLSGGTPKTNESNFWGGEIPWISAASLKSPWIYYSDRMVTRLGVNNGTRTVPEGSIIFIVRGMSLISEFRIGLTRREVAFGQDCKALIPKHGIDPVVLLLAIMASDKEILGMVDLAGHGTGRLSTDRIAGLSVRIPDKGAAEYFSRQVALLVGRASSTTLENRALAELRDTLLPKLVSGEIRVKDAARVVGDAV